MYGAGAMATRRNAFCIGCGHRTIPSDTRTLHSEDAKQVISTWRAFVEHVCEDTKESEAVMNANGDPSVNGKMCRKCFSMYIRFSNLQATIEDNISEVTKFLLPSDSATAIKRPQCNAPSQCRTSIPKVGGPSKSSPTVAVSNYCVL